MLGEALKELICLQAKGKSDVMNRCDEHARARYRHTPLNQTLECAEGTLLAQSDRQRRFIIYTTSLIIL